MSLFLLAFFVLYGAMHAYLLVKAQGAFSLSLPMLVPFAAFLLLMVGGPVIVRVLEKAGMEGLALLAASVAYPWMGFLFLFFAASVTIDVARLFVCLAGAAVGWKRSAMAATRRLGFCLAIVIAGFTACWGAVEADRVRTETLVVKTDKLPEGVSEVRIVQMTDLHLGLTVRKHWLRRVVDEVRSLRPDILVSTGDLLDGNAESLRGPASMFREIAPRYGKFAITGNHEFYAGIGNFMRFAQEAGFHVLRGEGVSAQGVVNLAGVDDIAGRPFYLYRDVEEKRLLSGLPPGRFTVLLKHRPVIDPMAVGFFDLQLSGHTHGGQIFPFGRIVRVFFPFLAGNFDLGPHSTLHVSRGTGTWGPPIRFLTPPEITLIVVTSDKGKTQP